MKMCLSYTVTEIFSVEYWRDLEMWVRDHWRPLEMAPFDRGHTSSYSFSVAIMTVFVPFLNV